MECPPTLPVWTQDPTVCRCCLAMRSHKYLAAEYFYCGQKEVYQDMLMETFNIKIQDNLFQGSNGRICDLCIQMLRDAYSFKKMVWNSVKSVNDFISNITDIIEEGIAQSYEQTSGIRVIKEEPPDPDERISTDNTTEPNEVTSEGVEHKPDIELETEDALANEEGAELKTDPDIEIEESVLVNKEGVQLKSEPDILETEDALVNEALIEPPADPITVCQPIVKEEAPVIDLEAKTNDADENDKIMVPDHRNGDGDDDDDDDEESVDDDSEVSETTDSECEERRNPSKEIAPKEWILVKTFKDEDDAIEFLKSEDTWSQTYHRRTEEGIRKYYRCNKVKRMGPQCSAALYLLFADHTISAYKTSTKHDHNKIVIKDKNDGGIKSEKTKDEIKKLLNLRMTPRSIYKKLSQIKGIELPTLEQLEAYLQKEKSRSQKHNIDYKKLQRWIDKHSDIPRSFKKPFVLNYDINDGRLPSFRFAISTKGLLKQLCSTDILHADTTATLSWRGLPVYVIGATDKLHKFHPVCLAVATGERKEDFQVTFQGLKDKVFEIYNHTFKPRVLICNASQNIKMAFVKVFGSEAVIRTCWTHVRTSILKEVNNILKKHELLSDLEALRNANTCQVFNMASKAFLNKWQRERKLMKYIKDQWFTKYRNWYLGVVPLSPLTNSDLVLFIKKLKDRNLIREKLKLTHFLVLASNMVRKWSMEYFLSPVERMIELNHWREAYLWNERNLKIEVTETDSMKTVYQISERNPGVKYNENWGSFDEYKDQIAIFRRIVLPNDDWKSGVCDCQEYFENFMCKHILGLIIRLKPTEPPLEAKDVTKRKRRRKSSCS